MNILRKALVGLAASLLTVTLFGFGFSWSLEHVIGTPDAIKQALRDGKVYDSAVSDALSQAQKNQQSEPGKEDIPVDNPEVQAIIKQAFPPSYLQGQTEGVLDDVYAWINGKTPSLNFTIDLTEAKQRLADGVGSYVQQHLSSLPACAPGQLPANSDIDAFNATCVPAGYNIAEAAAKARDQIAGGDFLKDTKLTASNIKTGNDGETLDQKLHKVPGIVNHVKQGVMATGLVAVLLAVAVVFLSPTWRRGLRRLAIICLSIGIITALFGWLASYGVHRAGIELSKSKDMNTPLQHRAIDVAQSLANDLRTALMTYGLILVVLGIGTLVGVHFLSPGEPLAEVSPSDDEGPASPPPAKADSQPEGEGDKPPTPPKKSNRKKLVQ